MQFLRNQGSCVIKRRLSNFCLKNKNHGKRDNDDQQCRRCLSTLHVHKKKTQPVTIKVKACANKYACCTSWQWYFKWFTQVCSVNLCNTTCIPNSTQSFYLSRKCDPNRTVTIIRTLIKRTRRSICINKTNHFTSEWNKYSKATQLFYQHTLIDNWYMYRNL